jgi:hypothetical protein
MYQWLALVLHPSLKIEYSHQHGWEEDWIEQAQNMIRKEYIGSYEEDKQTAINNNSNEKPSKVSILFIYIFVYLFLS